MSDDRFFDVGDPSELIRLLEKLRDGEMQPFDVLAVLSDVLEPLAPSKDVTAEYRSALHALGFDDLSKALERVTIRLGKGNVGVTYAVERDKGFDLESLDDKARDAMTRCIVYVLRAYNFDAEVAEDGHIVFNHHHDDAKLKSDFHQTISTFTDEIERELGPSVPEPGESRWGRWM